MEPATFYNHLEENRFLPVYLFVGEAELLVENAWRALRTRLVPARTSRFNGECFAARDVSAAEVVERISTLSMFGGKRLLMVKHVEAWSKEQQQVIASYVGRPNPTSCLVLVVSAKSAPTPLRTAVESVGMVVEFAQPTEAELPRWLQQRASHYQKKLGLRAAATLLERVGPDLSSLDGELEKVCLFVGGRKSVEASDVEQVVSPQRQYNVFALLDAVAQGRSPQAIAILHQLLLGGEPPLLILTMLARDIRIVWQMKDALDRGFSLQEVTQQLKLHPYTAKKYQKSVARFSSAALYHAHDSIRRTDLALKRSAAAAENLLEALVLALCRRQ